MKQRTVTTGNGVKTVYVGGEFTEPDYEQLHAEDHIIGILFNRQMSDRLVTVWCKVADANAVRATLAGMR